MKRVMASLPPRLRRCAVAVLAGTALAGDLSGQAREETLLWVSRSQSLPALSDELAMLIATLEKADALPTTTVEDSAGEPVERILRERQLFYGAHFPRQLDAVVCRLNRIHCAPSGTGEEFQWSQGASDQLVLPDLEFEVSYGWVPRSKKRGEDLTATLLNELGGCSSIDDECDRRLRRMNEAGLGVLRPEFEGMVRLPVLQLSTRVKGNARVLKKLGRNLVPKVEAVVPVVTREAVPKAPALRIEVPEPRSEAHPAPAPSRVLVRDRTLGEVAREGSPAGVEAGRLVAGTVDLGGAVLLRVSPVVRPLEAVAEPDVIVPAATPTAHPSARASASAPSEALASQTGSEAASPPAPEPMPEGVVSDEAAEGDGGDGEGDEARADASTDFLSMEPEARLQKIASMQEAIFSEVAAPSPVVLRAPYLRANPVVSVLDGLVDAKHCGFAPGRLEVFPLEPANPLPELERGPCGDYWASPDSGRDHATHVTGLIMATEYPPANGPKLRGLDPVATVRAYEVPLASRFDQSAVKEQLEAAAFESRVVNFSFFYPRAPGNDLLEEVIKANELFFLVVAAAGNDGNRYEAACTRLPACLDLPNVIAVAALTLSPDSPEPLDLPQFKSDYGPRIHIGAPGLDVPSTIFADRIALYTGTSQAAPLVSAAAALVFARMGHVVTPRAVRDRLIYTSDLLPSLEGKLFGGRLNVARAMDLETAMVTLRPGSRVWSGGLEHQFPEGVTLRGRIGSFGDPPSGDFTFVVRREDSDVDEDLNLKRVRRLNWVAASNTYNLFYDWPDSRALDRQKVFLRTRTGQFWLNETDGGGLSGPCRLLLSDVTDYVSLMEAQP